MDKIEASPEDIRQALERVLASSEFSRSNRLSRFLRFLVEETLAGRGDRLKGYAVGIQVFDRDEGFDPDQDSIVRVQAGRLRRMLRTYYLTAGREDAVIIEVPKGRYVPKFRTVETSVEVENGPARWRRPAIWKFVAAGIGISIFAALAVGFAFYVSSSTPPAGKCGPECVAALPRGPKIAVMKFGNMSDGKPQEFLSSGIALQIASELARFKDLFVLSTHTSFKRGTAYLLPDIRGKLLGVQYVLGGTVRRAENRIRISVYLVESETSRILWSQVFDEEETGENLLDIEMDIASQVAAAVGQPYGVIHRAESRRMMGKKPKEFSSYECVLFTFAYISANTEERHASARRCLEGGALRDPYYSAVFALLSWIHGDEHRRGFNPRPEADAPMDRSIQAGRHAVVLQPDSALAHEFLARAYFTAGETELVRDHMTRALSHNPNDADLLAEAGWALALLGEWERGVKLVRKAVKLNPAHPRWYRGIIAFQHYRSGDLEAALTEARSYFAPADLKSQMLLTAILADLGRDNIARKSAKIMLKNFPGFPSRPRGSMRQRRFPDALIDKVLTGLRKAGVEVTI